MMAFELSEAISVADALGNKFKNILSRNSVSSDMSVVNKLNASEQVSRLDKSIYAFLSALSIDENRQQVEILNAYEHLSNLSILYYIGPLNFALNILFHFITDSKQVLELRSKYSPSASYNKALEYLSKNSESPVELKPERDSV